MDLPRPKALLSHHGFDSQQGAIAGMNHFYRSTDQSRSASHAQLLRKDAFLLRLFWWPFVMWTNQNLFQCCRNDDPLGVGHADMHIIVMNFLWYGKSWNFQKVDLAEKLKEQKLANNKQNKTILGGAVAVVVVVCVGFLLVLLVIGVLKMRDTPIPSRRRYNIIAKNEYE